MTVGTDEPADIFFIFLSSESKQPVLKSFSNLLKKFLLAFKNNLSYSVKYEINKIQIEIHLKLRWLWV